MSRRIANELYDIFVAKLGAVEELRHAFCHEYEGLNAAEIHIYLGNGKRALYCRKWGDLGSVTVRRNPSKQNAANRAIRELQTYLADASPLEKLAWFNEVTT